MEWDHGRLKAPRRPMRGVKTRSARTIFGGHAFVQNLVGTPRLCRHPIRAAGIEVSPRRSVRSRSRVSGGLDLVPNSSSMGLHETATATVGRSRWKLGRAGVVTRRRRGPAGNQADAPKVITRDPRSLENPGRPSTLPPLRAAGFDERHCWACTSRRGGRRPSRGRSAL